MTLYSGHTYNLTPPSDDWNGSVLVVEDNLHTRELLSAQLELHRLKSVCVPDGKSAMNWLNENQTDVVLLDLMLPDIDGLAVCQNIREKFSPTDLPILMLSARGDQPEVRLSGLQAGANDFMAKPHQAAELVARINVLLKTTLKARHREAELQSRISQIIVSTPNPDKRLYEMAKIACEAVRGTAAAVCEINQEDGTVTLAAQYLSAADSEKGSRELRAQRSFPEAATWITSQSSQGIRCQIEDTHLNEHIRSYMTHYGVKSALFYPLPAGYIEIWNSQENRRFSDEDIRLLQIVASEARCRGKLVHANKTIGDPIQEPLKNGGNELALLPPQGNEGNFNSQPETGVFRDVSARRQEKTRFLQQFISNISHDLKASLSIINLTVFMLRKATLPEAHQRHLTILESQVSQLTHLVEGMLRLSKLDEAPEFNFESVELNRLVGEILTRLQPAFADKNHTLHFTSDPTLAPIQADAHALDRAISNIVMNAIHYTTDPGDIHVEITHSPTKAIIKVKDSGIGIAAADLPHIFERFYRADKTKNPNIGGLGLAIVKEIIEAHKGHVEVESAPGSGSTFSVHLPLKN
jgi:signal transduction histidine kinase/DNA-binding response OmpR family regulator